MKKKMKILLVRINIYRIHIMRFTDVTFAAMLIFQVCQSKQVSWKRRSHSHENELY